jgi:hypothetical protein
MLNAVLQRNIRLVFPGGSKDIDAAKGLFPKEQVDRVRREARCTATVALAILMVERGDLKV